MTQSYLVGKRNGHTTVWTQERVELLVTLWLAGHTATVISRRLGSPMITRTGVLAKVWRLELPGRRKRVRRGEP